jgi:hypothetical protein
VLDVDCNLWEELLLEHVSVHYSEVTVVEHVNVSHSRIEAQIGESLSNGLVEILELSSGVIIQVLVKSDLSEDRVFIHFESVAAEERVVAHEEVCILIEV